MRAGMVLSLLLIGCMLYLAGCSFHVGFDYNGKTGVDNRTQSKLAKESK